MTFVLRPRSRQPTSDHTKHASLFERANFIATHDQGCLTVVRHCQGAQDGKRAWWRTEKGELHTDRQFYALGQDRGKKKKGSKLCRPKMSVDMNTQREEDRNSDRNKAAH